MTSPYRPPFAELPPAPRCIPDGDRVHHVYRVGQRRCNCGEMSAVPEDIDLDENGDIVPAVLDLKSLARRLYSAGENRPPMTSRDAIEQVAHTGADDVRGAARRKLEEMDVASRPPSRSSNRP